MTASTDHLSDHVAGFERYLETATRLLPVTRKRYSYEVRRFAELIGDPPLEEITPMMLLDWNARFHDAGAAASTVVQKHSALRKFFAYCEEFLASENAGRLLRVFQRQLQTPVNKGPVRPPYVLDEEIVKRMLDAIGGRLATGVRDRALVHFLWSTGARNFELTGLTMSALDVEQRLAVIAGKGDKERLVVFDQDCQEDLKRWLERRKTWPNPGDYVFCTVDGARMSGSTVSSIIKQAARRARFRRAVWPHVFRHTRITDLLNRGMSLQDTATMAGHTDVKTTMRYFHQEPEKLRDAYDKATERKEP